MRPRRHVILILSALVLLPALPVRAMDRAAEATAAASPSFAVAGAFCAPRAGSPLASAAGFGVAALAVARFARRRGPGAG